MQTRRLWRVACAVAMMAEELRLAVRPAAERATLREQARARLMEGVDASPPRAPADGVQTLDRIHFGLRGLTSRWEARRLERRVRAMSGVEEVRVRFADGRATVAVLDGQVDAAALRYVFADAGLASWVLAEVATTPEDRRFEEYRGLRRNAWRTLLPAAVVIAASVVTRDLRLGSTTLRSVVTDAQLYITAATYWAGRDLFRLALSHLGWRRAGRELPLAIAAVVALGTAAWEFFNQREPWFDIAVAIVFGYHLCAWLEVWLHRVSVAHFRQLLELRPRWATVQRAGRDFRVAIRDLEPDDAVVVGAGEVVPVDGEVRDGSSVVDESAVMGEGATVQKSVGARVFAGSVNTGGDGFVVVPQQTGDATVLGRMLQVLEDARAVRAPMQRRGDRLAALVMPGAILLAIATFVFHRLQAPELAAWAAVGPALAVLVITVPWALGWASAIPVSAGMTEAARQGVLFRDAGVLEEIRGLDAMAFEKAGTLTTGRPEVESMEVFGDIEPRDALRILMAVESQSKHALAETFFEYTREHFGDEATDSLPAARSFRTIPGRGVIARVADQEVVVGSAPLLEAKGVQPPEEPEGVPGSYIYLAVEGELRARAHIFDPFRDDSIATVGRARAAGLRPMLLTAGTANEAERVANAVGIKSDDVRAGIDAAEHGQAVRVLTAAGVTSAVVGNAGSDQPSLQAADVAFAIAEHGEVPSEPHEVILLRPGARGVITALDVAHATFRIIRQNLIASTLVMLAAVPAALGVLPPHAATGGLAFTVLMVGVNGLRNRPTNPKTTGLA